MRIARAALRNHLAHIHCEGLLPDVVLTGQFSGVGTSTNHLLVVMAGPIDKVEPLSGEIGVTNLSYVIKALDSMEDDEVSMTVEDRFIVLSSHDRTYRLVTSAPRVIGTRVDPETQVKVQALIPAAAQWRPLEHRLVEGVIKAQSMFKADVMTLSVGPKGSILAVGDPRMNVANFDLPDLAEFSEYKLLLPSESMVPVLKQLSDFTKAQILLTGKDSVVVIREGSYTYIVSPDKEEKEK